MDTSTQDTGLNVACVSLFSYECGECKREETLPKDIDRAYEVTLAEAKDLRLKRNIDITVVGSSVATIIGGLSAVAMQNEGGILKIDLYKFILAYLLIAALTVLVHSRLPRLKHYGLESGRIFMVLLPRYEEFMTVKPFTHKLHHYNVKTGDKGSHYLSINTRSDLRACKLGLLGIGIFTLFVILLNAAKYSPALAALLS